MSDAQDTALDLVFAGMRRVRSAGVFVVARERVVAGDVASARRKILTRHGYKDPGEHWDPLSEVEARENLSWLLHRDLAYRLPFGDVATAAELAERFVALCGPGSWWTNGSTVQREVARLRCGDEEDGQSSSWYPLSSANFDAGVLFVGAQFVAIAWAEDAD